MVVADEVRDNSLFRGRTRSAWFISGRVSACGRVPRKARNAERRIKSGRTMSIWGNSRSLGCPPHALEQFFGATRIIDGGPAFSDDSRWTCELPDDSLDWIDPDFPPRAMVGM